jgi:hypothetical protein
MIQCNLKRVNGDREVAWVPASHAVPGKYLEIKRDGEWENGWQVINAFVENPQSSLSIVARERDFKSHRSATDI